MFIDILNLVSDAQALTATALSDKSIDLGNVTPKRQVGTGEPEGFFIQVDVAADFTTTNETYQIDIINSANADLSAGVVIESRIITAALLALGSIHYIPLPAKTPTLRYLGLQYTLGGTTPTVTLTAGLQPLSMIDVTSPAYASGFLIA